MEFSKMVACAVCGAMVASELLGEHQLHTHLSPPKAPQGFYGVQSFTLQTSTSSSRSR
jgi:hypothetical protein